MINSNEKVLMWVAEKTKTANMRFPQTSAAVNCIVHRHLFWALKTEWPVVRDNLHDLEDICDEIELVKNCGFEFDLQYVTNKCVAEFDWEEEHVIAELRSAMQR